MMKLELFRQLDPDFGGQRTNTITIEPYPNEKVVIDGTISIDVDWRPTSINHIQATVDSSAIADQIQRLWDVYVWIDGRYQIPSVTPNIKTQPIRPTESYDQVSEHWENDIVGRHPRLNKTENKV